MEPMLEVTVVFASLNIILLVALLYLYGRIAWRSKAAFSIGLLFFSILLLLHNLLIVYSYVSMANVFGTAALPYLLGIAGLEFGGLVFLVRVTL